MSKPEPYQILLVDPPWQYGNVRTGGSMKSGSAAKYPTLHTDVIKRMGPAILGFTDPMASYLFLWTTCPMLPDAMEVMKSWGHTYKTMVTWEKTGRLGMGFYFRVNTEHLLVGTRGAPDAADLLEVNTEHMLVGVRGKTKPFRCSQRNILHSKPLGHSRKPDEAYDLIEGVTPGLRRLELFARRRREGWDCWGLEVESSVELPTVMQATLRELVPGERVIKRRVIVNS